jgi:hypothetical protein
VIRQPESLKVVTTWSKVSGPGDVKFGDAGALRTTASFSQKGRFVLRLSAVADRLTASDQVTIVVNGRPVVSAGQDQTIAWEDRKEVVLRGAVTDTGLGDPRLGRVNVKWEQIQGPAGGKVTFAKPTALKTTARFNKKGPYVLRLTANNGYHRATDEVVIKVQLPSDRKEQRKDRPDKEHPEKEQPGKGRSDKEEPGKARSDKD